VTLRIGVDAWNLPHDRRGLGRYVREVLRIWTSQPQPQIQVVLLVPEWPWPWVRRTYQRACGYDLPIAVRGAERLCSVVWYPWNGASWIARSPMVATLHDASVFALPQPGPAAHREQRPFVTAARHARRIITDSFFSKSELVRHLGLDADRVEVVGLGVGEAFYQAAAPRPADRTYVLFVGEPEARKGLDVLLQAMTLLPAQAARLEVIVAGASGAYPLPNAPPSVCLRNLGWVSDEELARLYAGSLALVYPSRYEGFGLPVLEAMAAGAPVIAADIPSLRETAGSAAIFVPPGDGAAIAAALVRLLSQPDLAAELRARGRRHAAAYTWRRTAEGVLTVLRAACTTPSRNTP
jgi:glycosyltransferase involved in cell wall biosynthesis